MMVRTGTNGVTFSPGCNHGPGLKNLQSRVMVRTRTKGLTFSPGCSHDPGLKLFFGGPRKRSPPLVPGGWATVCFLPVFRSFSFFIYFFYINMQRFVNCLVNKILYKKITKNNSGPSFALLYTTKIYNLNFFVLLYKYLTQCR